MRRWPIIKRQVESGALKVLTAGILGFAAVAQSAVRFAPQYAPDARRESVNWVDAAGDFWLFGGWSYAGRYVNDLWKFDGTNWTRIGGSSDVSLPGVYGTKGVAAPENMPGSRGESFSWVDRDGNLWLFGGSGFGSRTNVWVVLDDLWKFDGTNWTWVGGSKSIYPQAGVYGARGEASSGNMPGARYGGVSWTDHAGNFWLFGGWGYDGAGDFGWLNDLWKFDGTDWTWVSGASAVNQPGVYGIQGIAAPENVPGSRWGSVSWVDSHDNLWLFGGVGNWGMNFNDLWVFDGANWIWVSGAPVVNESGYYGTQGVAAPENVPGARDHSVAWVDANDNLWLFGGWSGAGFFNDLWRFDGTNWTWVDGSDIPVQPGLYGAAQEAGPVNFPNARWPDAAWIDADNNLWLFGGWNGPGYLNDLWNLGSETLAVQVVRAE
jgi:hypothetical protein